MKKIAKSPPPNALTAYAALYPANNWDDFRNHASPGQAPGADYKAIKNTLITNQGGLCAYCEQEIRNQDASFQQIEHYHPKSDTSNPAVNWALMWSNVFAVCTGGSKRAPNGQNYPLPENLSCDAHKNHLLNGKSPAVIASALAAQINPLNLPAFPCLFDFDKRTGELQACITACARADELQALPAHTTQTQVEENIRVLNLNCDRLCKDRREVLIHYNKELKKARENNDKTFHQKLVQRWFSKPWPAFFTTRRILLGQTAETYLQTISFQG